MWSQRRCRFCATVKCGNAAGSTEDTWSAGGLESLEFLARFKTDGLAGRNGDLGTRARIAADAGLTRADVEDAEPAKLNTFAGTQRALHAFENGFDSHFRFRLRDARLVDDFIDDIEFDQIVLPAERPRDEFARYPQPNDMIDFSPLSRNRGRGEVKLLDGREFRRCCGQFATGVAVACVLGMEGEPHGLTVNSFSSVSLDPPLILICIGHDSGILELFRQSRRFGLSFLRAEQRDLSNQFATRGLNRFEGVAWHMGDSGVPVLDATLADMECEVEQAVQAGDHDVMIARVVKASVHGGHPLLYFNSAYASIRG